MCLPNQEICCSVVKLLSKEAENFVSKDAIFIKTALEVAKILEKFQIVGMIEEHMKK